MKAIKPCGGSARQDIAPHSTLKVEDDSILTQYPLALTVAQTAEVLGITPARCRELLRRGLLPGIRLGNIWRIPRPALERLLSSDER